MLKSIPLTREKIVQLLDSGQLEKIESKQFAKNIDRLIFKATQKKTDKAFAKATNKVFKYFITNSKNLITKHKTELDQILFINNITKN